ncbi:MAG: trypsin-like peptidase domain-containing protein [Planctomycetota bacterium]|jgi:S1-C subfamily serine protease
MVKTGRILAVTAFVAGLTCTAAADAVDVFERARRGVVTIHSPGTLPPETPLPSFERLEAFDRVLGSGVVLGKNGLILTAHHAVSSTRDVIVVMWDMTATRGEVIASEPFVDLALVRIRRDNLEPIRWRTETPARIGETVYAIGTPSAFSSDPTPSISKGIVSALHRTIEGVANGHSETVVGDLIETDAQVSPGQSGGALVDEEGRLLGMCLAVYRPAGGGRGRSFAVPADAWLRGALVELAEKGAVPLGSFGAQVIALSFERAKRYGLRAREGVEVVGGEENGPFERAGIRSGDIVTTVNGEAVISPQHFRQTEARQAPGSRISVEVVRPGDGRFSLEVEVALRPSESRREPDLAWRGMALSALNEDVRKQFGIHYRDGVCVRRIESTSNAYKAGLRTGDVIVEINDERVRTLSEFRRAAARISDNAVVRVQTTDGIGHIQGETFRK